MQVRSSLEETLGLLEEYVGHLYERLLTKEFLSTRREYFYHTEPRVPMSFTVVIKAGYDIVKKTRHLQEHRYNYVPEENGIQTIRSTEIHFAVSYQERNQAYALLRRVYSLIRNLAGADQNNFEPDDFFENDEIKCFRSRLHEIEAKLFSIDRNDPAGRIEDEEDYNSWFYD